MGVRKKNLMGKDRLPRPTLEKFLESTRARKTPIKRGILEHPSEKRQKREADFSLLDFLDGGGRKIPKPDPLAPSGEINLRKRLILYHISGVTRF